MRILMVSDYYRSVSGGIEVFIRNLGRELSDRGHDVAVAAISHGGFPDFEMDGAVRVYRVRTTTRRLSALYSDEARPAAPPFPDPEATLALKRVLEIERPDIVHGHDWLVRSFLPLKRWSGARLVMSLHYYTTVCARKDLVYENGVCSGPAVVKCFRCAIGHYGAPRGVPVTTGNFVLGAAERRAVEMYLPVSHATALGNRLPGSRLPFEVIHNFIVRELRDADSESFHLGQLPESPFLLFAGDLGEYKGVRVLLDAYSSLEGAPPLVLIGKVAPKHALPLPPNVTLLTGWPNGAVREAQQRSLAVIVPSIWADPCPMVVIEAMAAGRPVIGSSIGGIPELVVDGETGLLVPPGDPVALGHAITNLVANPELSSRLGQSALVRAESFTAPYVVPRFERIYSHVLGRSAPGAHSTMNLRTR